MMFKTPLGTHPADARQASELGHLGVVLHGARARGRDDLNLLQDAHVAAPVERTRQLPLRYKSVFCDDKSFTL
jgi:hypothetical protein